MLGLIHESYYTQEEENHSKGCHLMSTLGTGHAAEYTRLPISLALLLYLPPLLAPLRRRYANLLEPDSARVRKRKGRNKKTVLEIANHQPCEKTRVTMEIGHNPRSCVLVGPAFNIRSTRPSTASSFFFHLHNH